MISPTRLPLHNFQGCFRQGHNYETLTFDGSAETNGKVSVTGAAGDDDITGGEGIDTLVGGAGADALDGGDGTTATTDVFKYVTTTAGVLVAGGDTITGFVTGQDQLEFGQAAIAADGLLPAVAELLLSNDADYVAPTDVSAFDSASGEKFLFQAGTAATLDGATFLYDAATGALAYDKTVQPEELIVPRQLLLPTWALELYLPKLIWWCLIHLRNSFNKHPH